MNSITKYLAGGTLMLGIIITGFLFAIRGCLSAYDERYALPPILFFEKEDKQVLVSLVKFSQTTSYVQEGGTTTKTFSNKYFIQCNNAATGEKLLSEEIEGHNIVKHFPEEVLGAAGNKAWIFIDELMAFDAFTLQKLVDFTRIENKNPLLKGKLPGESRYYHFNNDNKNISFTAKDGSQWLLNTTTLVASPEEVKVKSEMGSDKIVAEAKLRNLQRLNTGFKEMMINQDTVNAQWLGMYSKEELEKLNPVVSISTEYGDETRRQLFTTVLNKTQENNFCINKTALYNTAPEEYFLDGGFLLNKQTAKPICLTNPNSHLVIYKSQVGIEGKLMLSRIDKNGKQVWKLNTGLSSWIDWIYTNNRLYIFVNNKTPGLTNCTLLLSINVDSGVSKWYDYFSDKSSQSTDKKDLPQTLQPDLTTT